MPVIIAVFWSKLVAIRVMYKTTIVLYRRGYLIYCDVIFFHLSNVFSIFMNIYLIDFNFELTTHLLFVDLCKNRGSPSSWKLGSTCRYACLLFDNFWYVYFPSFCFPIPTRFWIPDEVAYISQQHWMTSKLLASCY